MISTMLSGTAGTSLREARRPPARAPCPGSAHPAGSLRIRTPSSVPRLRSGKARPRRLVSIIFSLLFLVVRRPFSSLSPRLNLFRDDPVVWRTFGLAAGVLVFSVTAALVIGNDPEVPVIVPAAEAAGVLAAIALIRALQVKAFASIQLAPALSAVAARGRGPR